MENEAVQFDWKEVGPAPNTPSKRAGMPVVTLSKYKLVFTFNTAAVGYANLGAYEFVTPGHDPKKQALLFQFHNDPNRKGAIRLGGDMELARVKKRSPQRSLGRTQWTDHKDLAWLRNFHAQMTQTQRFVLHHLVDASYYILLELVTDADAHQQPELFEAPPAVPLKRPSLDEQFAALSFQEKLEIIARKHR